MSAEASRVLPRAGEPELSKGLTEDFLVTVVSMHGDGIIGLMKRSDEMKRKQSMQEDQERYRESQGETGARGPKRGHNARVHSRQQQAERTKGGWEISEAGGFISRW